MPSKTVHTKIEDQSVRLTNLDKVLYPDLGLLKAEYIQYLLRMSEHLLPLYLYRPLTLIRYPDGIDQQKFYAKNKPSWTPEWIASTTFADDLENEYIFIDQKASLGWIGNLAALELHPMNSRSPNLLYPDQMIFDLDPPPNMSFQFLKEVAVQLKVYLEEKGLTPFVKTSGGKGLHLYIPLIPNSSIEEVYKYSKKLATGFIKKHPDHSTLHLPKNKRKNKLLIDVYRNAKAQSCVGPFSLRGRAGAPISTPFSWEMLAKVSHSQQWNIRNIEAFLADHGNAWEDMRKHAISIKGASEKKPTQLKKYDALRSFEKTIEPEEDVFIKTSGRDFVIQLHDATNLHYDLRLEEGGKLTSWAIPKGLPTRPGIKRLAVQTEDHPLAYLAFSGVIPKGQYGGGEMWIYDRGTYLLHQKTSEKYDFSIDGKHLTGKYKLYRTNDKQWLIERKNILELNLEDFLQPMLAISAKRIPPQKNFLYEIKWDGIRATFVIQDGKTTIYSRNGNDLTDQFPLLKELSDKLRIESAIIDGEIVHLDDTGKPLFHKIVGRIHHKNQKQINRAAVTTKATCYFFDLLYLDGVDCRPIHIEQRRAWLRTIIDQNETFRFSQSFDSGKELFDAIENAGMEGIIAKRKQSTYESGKRSSYWKKIKVNHEAIVWVIGYTDGEGDRMGLIGAMHLAENEGGKWRYRGKVGTGFDTRQLRRISKKLKELPPSKKLIKAQIEEPRKTTWIEPTYQCEITYASMSSNDTYREPVFQKLIAPPTGGKT